MSLFSKKCTHRWKFVSADITGSLRHGYEASLAVQCKACGVREFMQKRHSLPSKQAACIWIDSILDADSEIIKTDGE